MPLIFGVLLGIYIASRPPDGGGETESGLYFVRCGNPPHYDCVVDGDTFYLRDEAIRIAGIDAPETGEPQCDYEAALGLRATIRLQELLNEGPFEVAAPIGPTVDQYDRLLRTITRDGQSLGAVLVAEGLARNGPRRSWC